MREPFSIVPESVTLRCSPRALQVYALLARHTDAAGVARPGVTRLGELARCSEKTVDRALLELVRAGAIARVNGHARLGEAAVYALPRERVTRDPQGGNERVICVPGSGSPGTRQREVLNEKTRAHAREEEATMAEIQRRALELGEAGSFWVDNVGVHIAPIDAEAFIDDAASVFGREPWWREPELRRELLEHARRRAVELKVA